MTYNVFRETLNPINLRLWSAHLLYTPVTTFWRGICAPQSASSYVRVITTLSCVAPRRFTVLRQ